MNIAANFLIPSTPPSLPRKRTVTCCSSILIYNEDKVEDYIGNGTKELKEYFPTERVLPCNDGLRCKRDYNHFSPEEERSTERSLAHLCIKEGAENQIPSPTKDAAAAFFG